MVCDTKDREQGTVLMPKFDAHGLVTAVVTDADSGSVLMVAHMNEDALRLTVDSKEAHFWSRSRKRIWKKGEESGNVLAVDAMYVDCDQDAVWLVARIAGNGVACHTGAYSCFYRRVDMASGVGEIVLSRAEQTRD